MTDERPDEPERPRMSRRDMSTPAPVGDPAEWWLDQVEASAKLFRVASACAHCDPAVEVVSRYPDSKMPRAISVRHEPHCPDFKDD